MDQKPAPPWQPLALGLLCLGLQGGALGWQGRELIPTNDLQWRIVSDPPAEVHRYTVTPYGLQRVRVGRTDELWETQMKAADVYYSVEAEGYEPIKLPCHDLAQVRRYPPRGSLRLKPISFWTPWLRTPGFPVGGLLVLVGVWRWRRSRLWHQQEERLLEALARDRVEKGLQIGPYRVLGLLGRGGMGAVYEVSGEGGREVRALKLLNPQVDAEARLRFQREVRLSLPLRHPNLVAFYDFGEFADRFYLVMEKLAGAHLNQAWQGQPLSVRLDWLAQVARALEALHQQRILHRDIKPGNVMVCGAKVVLMDFGIAKELEGEAVSLVGQVLGTPGYMSPEQVLGRPLQPSSDLYSLGMLLYEACSNRLAYQAETDLELLTRQVSLDPEPLEQLRPDLPADFCAWVMQLLAREPERRPANAALVVEKLVFWAQALKPH